MDSISSSTHFFKPTVSSEEFGRKEYIEDAIDKILRGKPFLWQANDLVVVNTLPKIIQNKYISEGKALEDVVFFEGFTGSHYEICEKLEEQEHKIIMTKIHHCYLIRLKK